MSEGVNEKIPEKPLEGASRELPISEFYKVIDYSTIFRSNKWWEAIAVVESFGKRFIAMYMWQQTDGKWKRKHKFHIRNVDEWNKVKGVVEQLLPRISVQK